LLDLLAAVVFLGLGLGLVLPAYITGRAMPGDLGDARFNLAMLQFFSRELSLFFHGRATHFLSAPFFYPWPLVTNFSDTFWGDGEVFAVARALGTGGLTAFRIWFVAGFALTFVFAFLSFRALGLRSWGAAAAAFLFTFPLPMTAQFSHAQLIYRLWVPPAVVAFDRLLTTRSVRAGAVTVLFVALELSASIYLGLLLLLLLASYCAASFLVRRQRIAANPPGAPRPKDRASLGLSAVLLVAGVALLAVVALPYRHVQSLYGFGRSWPEVLSLLPRPGSYLLASASRIWPDLSHAFPYPAVWEQQLFPGLSALVAPLWFIVSPPTRRRHPLAVVMLVAAGILFLATINIGGHSFYRLIFPIAGFSAMRVVARVILVLMLPLSVLLGLLIDDLIVSVRHVPARRVFAVVLAAFLVVECSLVKEDSSAPADWLKHNAALRALLPEKLPHDAIFAVNTPSRRGNITAWTYGQIDAELLAASHGAKTINGYSGNFPPTWRTPSSCRNVGYDIRAGRHFLVEHGLPAPVHAAERLVMVGFGACNVAALGAEPMLELGHHYRFVRRGDGNVFAGDGFSAPESWGRWTDAKSAFLFFRLDDAPAVPTSIAIDARSFSAAIDRRQTVTITANGRFCGKVVVTDHTRRARVLCPA
ncbi:MAG: hypothetical protein ACRELF_13160, partial [Gemmataceae bacterium]